MITSVFKKSTPINLILVVFLILVFFLLYQIQDLSWTSSTVLVFQKVGIVLLILGSVFVTDFVVKRNNMSKDSSYTIFFFFLFLLFFPSIMDNPNVVISNLFVLLALRRLVSLQSLKASKEKIFDASLWIFMACLFHFWSILYIVLVFISITFHVARDYRNWVLPFIALFTVGTIASVYFIAFDKGIVEFINTHVAINFKLDYFANNYQNAAFSIYITMAMFFVISMFMSFYSKPLLVQSSFKKIITSFFIGLVVFIISDNKSNDLLLFTFAPLAIMATSHIEVKQLQLKQEMVLGVLLLCSMFLFFLQL